MSEPACVFKFCSAAGALKILENNSIFITSPLDLNDPFEMRPAWTNEHERRFRRDQHTRNARIEGIPIMMAMEGDKLQPGGRMPRLREPRSVDVADQRAIADQHEMVFRELHARYRVLSFATDVLDLNRVDFKAEEEATLMWAHYADQFQGVCLALDPSRFHSGMQSGGYPVSYEKVRRSLPPSSYDVYLKLEQERVMTEGVVFAKDAEAGLFLPPSAEQAKNDRAMIDLLTHKSPAWSYEREVRMLYDLRSPESAAHFRKIRFPCAQCVAHGVAVDACRNPLFRDAIDIPVEAVRGIIVGTDTPMEAVSRLLKLLKEPRYSHVARYWSSHHSEHYALHYSKDDEEDYVAFMQELRTKQVAQAKGHVRYGEQSMTIIPAKKGENYEMFEGGSPSGAT